jgi:hypothetical protein
VLERLDKVDGVEASSANHTGTLIRISVKAGASREKVAAAVQNDLTASKGNPTRLMGEELRKTLQDEEWRGIDEIGQLSAIEFCKLNLDRVRAFADDEKLGKDVADKLLKLAETEWDRLAKEAEGKDRNLPPHKADWRGRCEQFAKAVGEQAKELLTAEQLERFRQALTFRVRG